MYASNYSKNLITAEEKVAELMKQRDAALIRAKKAEAELISLRAEVRQARKAWLGGDYDHLPLIEAMEKFRNDRENEFDAVKADCERLQHLDSLLGQAAADVTAHTVTAGELAHLRAKVDRLNAQVALDDRAKLLLVRCNTSDRLRAEKADARIKELENGIEKLYLELRNGKKPINL